MPPRPLAMPAARGQAADERPPREDVLSRLAGVVAFHGDFLVGCMIVAECTGDWRSGSALAPIMTTSG